MVGSCFEVILHFLFVTVVGAAFGMINGVKRLLKNIWLVSHSYLDKDSSIALNLDSLGRTLKIAPHGSYFKAFGIFFFWMYCGLVLFTVKIVDHPLWYCSITGGLWSLVFSLYGLARPLMIIFSKKCCILACILSFIRLLYHLWFPVIFAWPVYLA